jgi:DNA topoisomerase IA
MFLARNALSKLSFLYATIIASVSNEYTLNPTIYKSKAQGAQEAHEAIRPTEVKLNPNDLRNYCKFFFINRRFKRCYKFN